MFLKDVPFVPEEEGLVLRLGVDQVRAFHELLEELTETVLVVATDHLGLQTEGLLVGVFRGV